MCAMTSMTQPTYLETFAHVSPYFDNPLLPNGFITWKLVKGKIWNIFSAIILTLRRATVILLRHDCRWLPCLLDRWKLTFTRVKDCIDVKGSHWCQKYMTSIQDGCSAIKANYGIIFHFTINMSGKPKIGITGSELYIGSLEMTKLTS